MKVLILSTIAAPYRIAVFAGLGQVHETTVFLERNKDGERNRDWFQGANNKCQYHLLVDEDGRKKYEEAVSNIRQFDIVLCYEPFTTEARRLERICMRKKVPYIVNVDGALGINRDPLKRIVKRFYISHAAKCFAGSKRAEEYCEYYGAKRENIVRHKFTSMYTDEILKTPLTLKEKASIKERLNIRRVPTFLAVGQFIHRKGFDLLLDAWKEIKGEECQLLLIGGGSLKDLYEKFIAEHGIRNVTLLDFVQHDQLMEYIKACDYFVMPTREDIWGLVINEAMSLGVPVISSDHCTAANELIIHGKNGFLYSLYDKEKLVRIIESRLKNDGDYMNLSYGCLEAIRDYTYENIIMQHIKVLEEYAVQDSE